MWLGWLDSNQRMSAPKADALPLGDTPINQDRKILMLFFFNLQVFFLFFMIFFEKLREKKNKSNKIKVLGESSMQVKMF